MTTIELNWKSVTKPPGKLPNIWKLSNTLPNNAWIKGKLKPKNFKIIY